MPDKRKVDKKIDLRGLPCPGPVLHLGKVLKDIPGGAVIEALVNDPTALASLPAWARVSGNQLIDIEMGFNEIRFYFKKG